MAHDTNTEVARIRDRVRALRELAGHPHIVGEAVDVEPLYLQAAALAEVAFGPDDPDLAAVLRNLALFYRSAGRNAEAESLLRRVVAASAASWGEDAYETALDRCHLAAVLVLRGHHDEAAALYELALPVKRRLLNPRHPAITTTLHNLAVLRDAEGRVDEARSLWAEARAALEAPPAATRAAG